MLWFRFAVVNLPCSFWGIISGAEVRFLVNLTVPSFSGGLQMAGLERSALRSSETSRYPLFSGDAMGS